MVQGQELLVYACACGYTNPDKTTFNRHLLTAPRKDGKGVHKSRGRINPGTGEIVMPPFNERSLEQKKASVYALKKKDGDGLGGSVRLTEIIHDATQVKFVPRVLVSSFTPIMLSGKQAAEQIWGWRPDMPFENFLDTVIFHFFRDRGIELASYIVHAPDEHAETREANLALQKTDEQVIEEVPDGS
jgi:hypothetical protein